jgi:hypothetical protein
LANVNGKEYKFKYITADLFVKGRKALKKLDESVIPLVKGEEDPEPILAQLLSDWSVFCGLVFEGEKPLDVSVADIMAVAQDFFVQAVGPPRQ